MSFKDFLAIIICQAYNQGDGKWGGRIFQYYVKTTASGWFSMRYSQGIPWSWAHPRASFTVKWVLWWSATLCVILCTTLRFYWPLGGGAGRSSASRKGKPISRISIRFCKNVSWTLWDWKGPIVANLPPCGQLVSSRNSANPVLVSVAYRLDIQRWQWLDQPW